MCSKSHIFLQQLVLEQEEQERKKKKILQNKFYLKGNTKNVTILSNSNRLNICVEIATQNIH